MFVDQSSVAIAMSLLRIRFLKYWSDPFTQTCDHLDAHLCDLTMHVCLSMYVMSAPELSYVCLLMDPLFAIAMSLLGFLYSNLLSVLCANQKNSLWTALGMFC
jgi:hypothetical protein